MDNQELFLSSGNFLEVSDGERIFYHYESGTSGPVIIWCYGLVCSNRHFKYQFDYFKDKADQIFIDYRGHHSTAIPKDINSISIERIARDIAEIVEHLGIKEHSIVGHSLGGNVVFKYSSIQDPKKLKKIVCMNTPVDRPFENMFHSNITEIAIKNLYKLYKHQPKIVNKIWKNKSYLVEKFVHMTGFNKNRTKFSDVQEYLDRVRDIDPRVFFQLVMDLDNFDRTIYPKIKQPCLIIHGKKDNITPQKHARTLHQLIPKSQLEWIEEGSHVIQMDYPQVINDLLEDFILGY